MLFLRYFCEQKKWQIRVNFLPKDRENVGIYRKVNYQEKSVSYLFYWNYGRITGIENSPKLNPAFGTSIMFTVYALNSLNNKFIYVGMTENLNDRLVRHNKGYVHSTKLFAPFELIYTEKCGSGQQAREREKFLKSLVENKVHGIVR